jgi:predicted ABC-type ATPase
VLYGIKGKIEMNLNKPVLIVIAGPNGSGKTSVTSQILKHEWQEDFVYINPDNIAQYKFGDWNSSEAVLKAAQYSTELRENCLTTGKSFIFETVFSAIEKVDFLEKSKAANFFIRLFFVGTNTPTINAGRIAQRVMQGGHDVPIPKIISRYDKSITNVCLAATFVDRLYVYDNSEDYVPAKLLFRADNGKLKKVYSKVNTCAEPILYSV